MSKNVLVIGSLGNVGTEVVNGLIARGVSVRASDRSVDKVRERFGSSVESAAFDFTNPQTWEGAFKGVEKMFLMRPPKISNIKRDMVPALEAARLAGVKHVVFLSLIGIEQNTIVPHWAVEQYLRQSGQTWTMLRSSFFMQNLNTTHRDEILLHDEIYVPVGDARTCFIDVRDIGAVAALALSTEGHENKAYDLTGTEAFTYDEVADMFSAELGRKITYKNPSGFSFFWRQLQKKQPLMFALVTTWLYSNTKKGMATLVTTEIARLLGRPAITMKQYIKDYRASWLP